MNDPTQDKRKEMIQSGQPAKDLRAEIEKNGPVWDTEGLQRDFEVLGFAAPFVVVIRKSDGKTGTLEFTGHPRYYFGWQEDK